MSALLSSFADPHIQAIVGREEIRNLKLRAANEDEYMLLHDQESEMIYEQMYWDTINFYTSEEADAFFNIIE